MPYNLVQWGGYLFHITHRENLPTILARGLHSNNECTRLNLKYRSIADEGIQARRSVADIAVGPRGTIHDYVPFFFGARPTMLYAVKFKVPQEDILYLLIQWRLLDLPTTVFTDGHAATFGTKFYCGSQYLGMIDQAAAGATQWAEPAELRRKKAAEVLAWKSVPLEFIAFIATLNQEAKERVERTIQAKKLSIGVLVAPEYYYR